MANNDKKKISIKAKVLNFLSFGHLKRKAQIQTNDLNVKKDFNVSELFSLLNGSQNLLEFKIMSDSSLKLTLKDSNNLDIDHLKQFCDAIGIMKSNNTITIITKSAKYLYQILEDARK
ncbi:MAG: hypothetical protein IIT78_02040 [Mycoplasmataceae bacterium]|nr:hypothetical protein [Mycoplasmataceae bacterium]